MIALRPYVSLLAFLVVTAAHAQAAEQSSPKVVGHRGLLRHAPEDTLAGFRACLELRMGLECDVRRTRDGQLVCLHDPTLDRTTNGTGPVTDKTLDEIRSLDAGSKFDPAFAAERVPTIDEIWELLAHYRQHGILVAVDLKAEGVEREVVRLAKQHGVLDQLLFIGIAISDPQVRARLRQADAGAHTAALANTAEEFKAALEAPDADWVYLRFLPSPEQMAKVHGAGKRAFIAGATVSGHLPENWRRAAGAGLDAILTDYPLELAGLARQLRSSD